MELSNFEKEIMDLLLACEHEWFTILRNQCKSAQITREFSGKGFFIDFIVPESDMRIPIKKRFHIGDVSAEIEGLLYGAGFVLFIENGAISMLEGYCYGEYWPDSIKRYKLFYHSKNRELPAILKNIICEE